MSEPPITRLSSTPFVSLPAPYLDFSLVSLDQSVRGASVDRAVQALAEHGLVSEVRRHPAGDVLIVTSDPARAGASDETRFGVSGLAMTSHKMLVPWAVPSITDFRAIDPSCGQFASYIVEAGVAEVATDAFGYSPTFVSQHATLAMASNRLHLHVMVMRALDVQVTLDPVAVTANLFSDHGFFSQQSALSRTLVSGVTKVPVNHDVRLGEPVGTVTQVPKRSLEAELGAGPSTYGSLIDAGTERIILNARVALEAKFFENLLLEMSGGKDTRLVLGAAMSTRGWGERLQLKTRGKEDDADVRIASGIASMFGLSFFRGSSVEQFPLDIRENLDFWRSYYFGEYHRFAAGAWSVKGGNRSDLAMGGANGEIYRAFWSNVIQRDVAEGGTVSQFSSRFVRRVAVRDVFDAESIDALGQAVAAELEEGYGPTLEGYVEDHYLRHRNRSHCGLRGYSVMHEQAIWYPLMAPELFAASRSLPFEARKAGQVIYDVLMRLNPLLIDVPFDGPDPFVEVDRSQVPPRWERRLRLTMDPAVDAWRDAEAEDVRRQQARRSGRKPLMFWSQLPAEVEREFVNGLALMRKHAAVSDTAIASLEQRFETMRESNIRAAYQLASRVLAVADVLA